MVYTVGFIVIRMIGHLLLFLSMDYISGFVLTVTGTFYVQLTCEQGM